ncbi:MAG: HD domain-containing protein [Bacteroidaceae bacterium]|nr:HD domain-containing protein [Bacteroidaceae bacterium]
MTQEQIAANKQAFEAACRQHIHREGLDGLLAYLDKSDFYTAPTSTKFHLNEPGGLCRHSLNVFETALTLVEHVLRPAVESGVSPFTSVPDTESVAIATLLHDLCKIGLYHEAERFKKDDNDRWVKYMGYKVEDAFPFGHGEKSCFLIERFFRLKSEELLAIRWHMGMFDMGEQGSSQRFSFYRALELYPLVSLVHSADMLSSNLLEKTTPL